MHYEVAKNCIHKGLHVMFEKPISENINQAKSLISLAENTRSLLLVGHIERYNPAIMELKSRLDSGQLERFL